ncbi:MAG: hypothetical protein RIA71_08200 [Oceanicaulis sp.]
MKSIVAVLLAGLSLMALTACNTIQGVGRDITRTGEVIEDAVDG